jgi:hypothetical protein
LEEEYESIGISINSKDSLPLQTIEGDVSKLGLPEDEEM